MKIAVTLGKEDFTHRPKRVLWRSRRSLQPARSGDVAGRADIVLRYQLLYLQLGQHIAAV
jgi:hypothetical protein